MRVKVIPRGESHLKEYTFQEFQKAMGVCYLKQLEFSDSNLFEKVCKRCEKAERKGEIERKQKWLGILYADEIANGYTPDLVIQWTGEQMGYGVFTNVDLPKGAYIGEYTGIVRKKPWSLFSKPCTDYTYLYPIELLFNREVIIDAEAHGNYTRFINHSDMPNLEPLSVFSGGIMHLALFSLKKIPKGTQLLYDYGPDYWAKRKSPLS